MQKHGAICVSEMRELEEIQGIILRKICVNKERLLLISSYKQN